MDMDLNSCFPDIALDDSWFSELDSDIYSTSVCMDLFADVTNESKCLIHHDCMWTGHCGSKEHTSFDDTGRFNRSAAALSPLVKSSQVMLSGNCVSSQQQQQQQQQSLLKPGIRTSYSLLPPAKTISSSSLNGGGSAMSNNNSSTSFTLQTPPMSDDEETKPIITQTLQNLQDAIDNFGNIIDDDADLSDYFKNDEEDFALLKQEIESEEDEEEEEEEEEYEEEEEEESLIKIEEEELEDEEDEEEEDDKEAVRKNEQMRAYYAAESDHSYHKGNAMRASASLGIDTPSDSEEEIDVVSLGDKYNAPSSAPKSSTVGALPTNPSSKDRHQLQRTMQSRFPQGIKTMMPIKRRISGAPPAAGPSSSSSSNKARCESSSRASTGRKQYKRVTQHHHQVQQQQQQQHQRQYKRRLQYGHSSDSEPEPSEKRSLHNNMERQRRIDLRNLFEDLKTLVPEVNTKQRAAKVLILRGAAQYCRSLTNSSTNLNRQVDDLRKYQERLRARVSQLRRNLAAHR